VGAITGNISGDLDVEEEEELSAEVFAVKIKGPVELLENLGVGVGVVTEINVEFFVVLSGVEVVDVEIVVVVVGNTVLLQPCAITLAIQL
jgi:hypothetical protein